MNSSFDWRDMLRFDKMIAPTFLTILYYIHVGASILASLWFIMKGMDTQFGGGMMVMGGLVGLIIGPFIIRLFYELLIVVFKIHTRLSNIEYSLRGQTVDTLPTEPPRQNTPRTNPPNQPISPTPVTSPPNYFSSEHTGFVQTTPNPIPDQAVSSPIGFQIPTPSSSQSATDQPMSNFWTPDDTFPPFTQPPGPANPVPPIDLGNILQKIPNWPAVLAGLLVLYGVVSPYANLQGDLPIVGNMLGELLGNTYSIKNSPLGVLVVLSSLALVGISLGGFQWLWFVVSYAITLLGSALAFLSDRSLFSHIAKVKSGATQAGSALGQYIPEADRITNKFIEQAPSASQFLSSSFYIFVIAMLFLGYWALAGKYQERGFITVK